MKTVQMTLGDELVKAVNRVVKKLGTTRSAFTRDALRAALKSIETAEKERRDREGYAARPVKRAATVRICRAGLVREGRGAEREKYRDSENAGKSHACVPSFE